VLACLPGLLVVLLVMSLVPVGSAGSLVWLVAVLVLFGWTHPARLVRAQALRVRELDYVRVAEGLGKSRLWILREHVLPNAIDPALVGVGFLAASAILLESTVSFLGVGVSEPTPSLGALVASAIGSSWSVLFTGLALVALVLPWHALSEELRRRLQQGESAA
jgi:peptide/nickel transport system permease protein